MLCKIFMEIYHLRLMKMFLHSIYLLIKKFLSLSRNFRIQDSDGGFFEKFGSLLHARGESNEESFLGSAALTITDQDARSFPSDIEQPAESPDVVIESRTDADDEGKDSGNESAETDSDIEDKKEENFKKMQNSLVGMNVSKFIISFSWSLNSLLTGLSQKKITN